MIDKTFTVDTAPRLEAQLKSGELRIVAGEPGIIRVQADAGKASELEVTQRAGTVVIKSDKRGWRNSHVHATVQVPPETEALINVASADIIASGHLARLEVNTASGEVKFDTVDDLRVRTASGDVRGVNVTGDAEVTSASGDVRIESCDGKCTFTLASGDVTVENTRGPSLRCSTASGNVVIDHCESQDVSCKSMSGDIRLGVLPRTRVDLDVQSLSGSVKTPTGSGSGEPPLRELSVRARLVSGDLELFRAE